jgi:N-acetylmuramoyl-L-alanine amidase-like protein
MVTRRRLLAGSAALLSALGVARATAASAAVGRPMAATIPPGAASGFALPGGLFCPVPYMNRAAWGADESLRYTNNGGYWDPEWYPVKALTVHHTGYVVDPDGPTAVRDIYTKQTLYGDGTTGGGVGWGDIGYNLLIDDQGVVYEGRWSGSDDMPVFNPDGTMVTGAHVLHYNTGNIGICLLGFLDDAPATPAAQASLVTVLAYLAVAGHVVPTSMVNYVNAAPGYSQYTRTVHAISGHQDWAATDCPGKAQYPLLPGIRTNVAAALPEPVTPPSTSATPTPAPSTSGSPQPTTASPTHTPTPTKTVSRDRGGDAYVDQARKASPSAYPTKPIKPKASATPTPSASPSASATTPSPTQTASPFWTPSSAAASVTSEAGGPGWGVSATVAGVAAAGALGAWWLRQRRAVSVPDPANLSTVDAAPPGNAPGTDATPPPPSAPRDVSPDQA